MRDKHHVLIVNAQPRSAASWEYALERAGYHVSCAAHAALALQLLAGERVDAVLIDAEHSDMAGEALAQAVRRRWPNTRVLLLPAEAERAAGPQASADAGLRVLPKPVTTRALKKHLEQLLPLCSGAVRDTTHWHEAQLPAPHLLGQGTHSDAAC